MLIPTTVKRAEQKDKEERRIRREIELKQLEEQRRAEEEREARAKADAEAVARWQAREAEKALKEQREKEKADREYRQRMREHLLATGMSEDQIQAVLDKKKINETPSSSSTDLTQSKATYTRMARRHVSLETLRVKNIDFDLDVVSRNTHPPPPSPGAIDCPLLWYSLANHDALAM